MNYNPQEIVIGDFPAINRKKSYHFREGTVKKIYLIQICVLPCVYCILVPVMTLELVDGRAAASSPRTGFFDTVLVMSFKNIDYKRQGRLPRGVHRRDSTSVKMTPSYVLQN